MLAVLAECQKQLGVRRRLSVVATPAVDSPALFGLIRLKLLVPTEMLEAFSPGDWRYVLMHELAHIRRRDVVVNWLMAGMQALHWFNPIIAFAFSRMRADRELACDATVLTFTREEEVEPYGRTIIKLLERFARSPARSSALVGILENKKQMKRRITMIAQFKRNKRWPVLAVLLMGLLCAFAMTDAQTGPNPTASEPIPEPPLDVVGATNLTDNRPGSETNQPKPEQLYTRTFKLDPNSFYQILENAGFIKPAPLPSPSADDIYGRGLFSDATVSNMGKLQGSTYGGAVGTAHYGSHPGIQGTTGLQCSPDTANQRSLFSSDRTGMLFVRATREELDKKPDWLVKGDKMDFFPPSFAFRAFDVTGSWRYWP
ncbi:MAG: M56 family metallopeptidase [Candidatus Omnitrophica bacterium]|nr:M56 family metallopeptidase [Candidatus Omnitrophota bacterium]